MDISHENKLVAAAAGGAAGAGAFAAHVAFDFEVDMAAI